MRLRTTPRSLVALLAGLMLALGVLAGCGGGGDEGTKTDCGLDGCTITFPRDGTPSVSVLGINARLVGLEDGQANLEIAGHTISIPAGGETQAEGFTVRLERLTDTEVVIRITP